MRTRIQYIVLLLLLLLIVSCTAPQDETTNPYPSPYPAVDAGYPAP